MCVRQVLRISCLGCESISRFLLHLTLNHWIHVLYKFTVSILFLTCWRCYQFRIRQRLIVFLAPVNKVRGYIVSHCLTCLSVCLSVWLPSVDMILSRHVLRNISMDFSENLYIYYSTSEDVHQEFSYWLVFFIKLAHSVFGLCHFFMNRNCL